MSQEDNKVIPPGAQPTDASDVSPLSGNEPTVPKKGRRPRTTLVRRSRKKDSTHTPILQPHPVNGNLTDQEAAFVHDVTHPASEHFLQPLAAHEAAFPNDPKSHTESRLERTLAKPPVTQTLKQLLDTPEVRDKIHRGLESILEDVEHAQYRAKEWLDAMRGWAELTGNKAPDKVIAIPVNQQDRQQRYDEILDRIRLGESTSERLPSDVNDSTGETVLLPSTPR